MLGENVQKVDSSIFDLNFVGVKAPQFSFTRLGGADPKLGVEMTSTEKLHALGIITPRHLFNPLFLLVLSSR